MKDNQPNEFYEFGEFRLDAKKRRLWKNGEPVALTPKEFEVLFALVKRAGTVVEKEELLDAVWTEIYVEEATLTRNISFLRKKLGDEKFIETLPKRGYRFLPAVRKIENAPAALIIEEQTLSRVAVEETLTIPDSAFSIENREKPNALLPPKLASRSRRRLAIALGVLAMVVAVSFAVYQIFHKESEPKTILVNSVAPFSGLAGRETMPAFSPDGKFIAFAWNGGDGGDNLDIFVKLVGAGEPVRLTETAADEIFPAFSPDGRQIAFVRSFPDRSEVFIVPAIGGAERKLTSLDSVWTSVSFSPDGKTLAVVDTEEDKKQPGVFLVEIATGAKRRLTAPPKFSSDDAPRFSADGKQIAFVRASGTVEQDLFIVPAAGGEPRQLTFDRTAIRGAAFGGDASIIFASYRLTGQSSLWRISVAGGEPELIAAGGKNPAYPAISADGRRVAFVEESSDTNIWKISDSEFAVNQKSNRQSAVGNRQSADRKLIASSRADHSPQFSPDGAKIVFASDRTGRYEIWTADAEGKNQRQLTDSPNSAGSPRFSPDGKSVAYDAQIGGSGDIFVVSIDGGEPRNLTDSASHDVLPAWSADGRAIYFASNRTGDLNLWKVSIEGGSAEQITKNGAFESFASPDGAEIYFTKSRGAAGIWKIPSGGGEETPVAELAEAGYWRYWTATADGIYFVARSSNAPYKIMFFGFADKRLKEIAAADKPPVWIYSGLAATGGGKTILYVRADLQSGGIMLAELSK